MLQAVSEPNTATSWLDLAGSSVMHVVLEGGDSRAAVLLRGAAMSFSSTSTGDVGLGYQRDTQRKREKERERGLGGLRVGKKRVLV